MSNECRTKEVLVDKLLPGTTLKHVKTLAQQSGNFRISYQFGQGKDRTYIISFDNETNAEGFVRSKPCVDGKAISVSLYSKESTGTVLYFDCENNLGINSDSLTLIFELFDYVELTRAAMVCKMWHNVAMSVIQTHRCLSLIPTFSFNRLHCQLSNDYFVNILKKTNLTSLEVSDSPITITDDVARAIVDHSPNLRKFSASNVAFKNQRLAISLFESLPNLTYLDLKHCGDTMTDKLLQTILINCKSLDYLDISDSLPSQVPWLISDINDSWFNHLPASLKHLNISSSPEKEVLQANNNVLPNISIRCPAIETLDFSGLMFVVPSVRNSRALDAIEVMPSLNSLKLSDLKHSALSPGYPILLSKTPNLEVLDFGGNELRLEVFSSLDKNCPKLRSLDVSRCTVSNLSAVFRSIKSLNLTQLRCNYTKAADDALESVVDCIVGFQQLTVLEVTGFQLTNEQTARIITQLPQLSWLKINDCWNVTHVLASLLKDDPEFKLRTQRLTLCVRVPRMACSLYRNRFDKLDNIVLDFEFDDTLDAMCDAMWDDEDLNSWIHIGLSNVFNHDPNGGYLDYDDFLDQHINDLINN